MIPKNNKNTAVIKDILYDSLYHINNGYYTGIIMLDLFLK